MRIQEVLKNYNTYKLNISIAESEIEELKNSLYDVKSANLDGMPKAQGYTKSNVEECVVNTQDKIEKKERFIKSTKNKLEIIDNLVKTLKKYNQDIIIMRFYDMNSIEEIATTKNRGYGAIQKAIDKSINIMQKEYDKYYKI